MLASVENNFDSVALPNAKISKTITPNNAATEEDSQSCTHNNQARGVVHFRFTLTHKLKPISRRGTLE